MVILEDHFNDNNTYIIGEYIKNGCQTFKINELDKVCNEHNVPDNIKHEVLEQYNINIQTEENYIELSKHEDYNIREIITKLNIKECNDILVHDEDWSIRYKIATLNIKKYNDILVYDEDWYVKRTIAKYNIKECNDILINDEDWRVRYKIAEFNIKEYNVILINDENEYIRELVKNNISNN